jgi:hypothetical protein
MISAILALVMAVVLLSRETQKQGYSVFARGSGVPFIIQTGTKN